MEHKWISQVFLKLSLAVTRSGKPDRTFSSFIFFVLLAIDCACKRSRSFHVWVENDD